MSYIVKVFSFEPLWTVVCGVAVFVLCEWVKEIWLAPLQYYKNLKCKIAEAIVFYANHYKNPIDIASASEGKTVQWAKDAVDVRKLSAELSGFIEIISWITLGIPSKKALSDAATDLMSISNRFTTGVGMGTDSENKREDKKMMEENICSIRKNLKLYEYKPNVSSKKRHKYIFTSCFWR